MINVINLNKHFFEHFEYLCKKYSILIEIIESVSEWKNYDKRINFSEKEDYILLNNEKILFDIETLAIKYFNELHLIAKRNSGKSVRFYFRRIEFKLENEKLIPNIDCAYEIFDKLKILQKL